MAANDLVEKPAKQHATLFLLTWHLTTVRYTDWTEDIVSGGQTYTSDPRIGIKLPTESGGINERPATLTWPTTLAPADTLTTQTVHAEVQVLVTELIPGDDTTLATLYFGWVNRARRGRRGDKNLASLQLNSIKGLLRSPLGIVAMRTCAWRFGDANCQKIVVPDLQETGTIATLTDDVVTITGLTTTSTADYWFRGYLEVNGERINVRRYDTPNVFYLSRRPPVDWNGASVVCTPGCDKTVSTCKERWDNLDHFTGLGFKMPPRHPIIEFVSVPFQAISPNLNPLLQIPGLTGLYDVFDGVHKSFSHSDGSPTGLPLSQLPFREDDDTGWNSNNMRGSFEYRVAQWFDTSVVDPALRKNLKQLASVSLRPRFVKASVVGQSGFGSSPVGNCGAEWDWGPTDDFGGARWALRGWDVQSPLPSSCSSDFWWNNAYTIGKQAAGHSANLGQVNIVFSSSGTSRLEGLGQPTPYTYHDNVQGLTFLAVCRNRVVQSVFFLRSPTQINIATNHVNTDSLIFASVGSWNLSMGNATIQNGASGSPTEFVVSGALSIVDPLGSPPGINWRVYGVRVTVGGLIETLTSSQVAPYAVIDSLAGPSIMAPATGYVAVRDHIEVSAMAMWDRPLSDVDLGTAVQYLQGRYGVFHPPQ